LKPALRKARKSFSHPLPFDRLRVARVAEKMQGHYLDRINRINRIIDPLSSFACPVADPEVLEGSAVEGCFRDCFFFFAVASAPLAQNHQNRKFFFQS